MLNYFRMPLLDYTVLNEISLLTEWFSAADLANIVKEVSYLILHNVRFLINNWFFFSGGSFMFN